MNFRNLFFLGKFFAGIKLGESNINDLSDLIWVIYFYFLSVIFIG